MSEARGCLAVVADGSTDREVMSQLVCCALTKDDAASVDPAFADIVLLQRQTIRNIVDKYWEHASRSGDYGLLSAHALEFVGNVVAMLHGAVADLEMETGRSSGAQDVLVVSTDCEKQLASPDLYLEAEWAIVLPRLLWLTVERFYHVRAGSGFAISNLPLILPVAIFPSTDMLVAAAKVGLWGAFDQHGKSANELKRELYGVTELRALPPEAFKTKALDTLTPSAIPAIHKHIPESRLFLQILFWHRARQSS